MKEILEYTSYRQYIADYYADKKAKSGFTWQDFASEAGFSSRVYLKYVSEGRFNLSEPATARVADAMRLADYEQEYFAEMVKFDHAKGEDSLSDTSRALDTLDRYVDILIDDGIKICMDDELAFDKIADLVKNEKYSLDVAGYTIKNEQKKVYSDSARWFFTDKKNVEALFR